MKVEEYELILSTVGEELKDKFSTLNKIQREFINYCGSEGEILFIENQRFTSEERGYSNNYKIKKALMKVLALEYDENISIEKLPGTTETFHAVIALKKEVVEVIQQINSLKESIGKVFKKYVDERVKLNGQWAPVNKSMLKNIGKSRANLKQIKRRLNVHEDLYERISLSSTDSRPSYRKNKAELLDLLSKMNTEASEEDIKTIESYQEGAEFAYFYDKTYSVVDGNFRYKDSVYEDKSNEISKKFRTQKISSPIYLICEDPKNIDIEIIFRNKQKKQKKRACYKNEISKEKLLMTLPVFEYL
jgi:hypothetical protein